MYESELGPPTTQAQINEVFRKLNWNILPIFCLVAGLCYIDRTNLAFASIQLTRDLDFTPEVYGLGSGLFFLGYALFMIPSNILLLRLGAPIWLGAIVTAWGFIATSFCVLTKTMEFYILRFILGVAEAGAFPGMWYYLYLYYPTNQIMIPFSVLEAAVAVGNVVSAPLAAILLMLDGVYGLRGWQWVFILEGAPTIALGLLIIVILPRSPQQAEFLTSTEKRWLMHKVDQTRKLQLEAEAFSNKQLMLEACRNSRVWFVSFMGLLKNVATSGMLFWCPILARALLQAQSADTLPLAPAAAPVPHGHGPNQLQLWPARDAAEGQDTWASSKAALISSIPFICAALMALWLGHHSQRKNERALHLAGPYLTASILFASFPKLASHSVVLGFGALSVVIACTQGSNSIINSYIPAVASGPSVSVAMALYNSVANIGGLLGPWLIGEFVQNTGSYTDVFKVLGVIMGIASLMAFHTRHWAKRDAMSKAQELEQQSPISEYLDDEF